MITILLDSSSTELYVGLIGDNGLIDSTFYSCWQEQSEYMIVEINALLQKHNLAKEDIRGIVVATGPGSYTGVRIAITISKIISISMKVNIYPISSLNVLAKPGQTCICLMNARSGRSYFGVYKDHEQIVQDKIISNDEALDFINSHKDYTICGETKYLGIEGFLSNPTELLKKMLSFLKPVDPFSLKPVYLRD